MKPTPPLALVLALARRLASAWRVSLARASGARIGPRCMLGAGADLQLGRQGARTGQLVLGENCEIGQGAVLHPYGGHIELARWIHVGPGTAIYGHGGVSIGEGTLIAMNCRILSSSHTIGPFSTPIRSQPDILRPTKIGRDVWLGAGVTVLGGVSIGDGCVVGAGAVVTKDLPPGAIARGIPAVVSGWREGAPRP